VLGLLGVPGCRRDGVGGTAVNLLSAPSLISRAARSAASEGPALLEPEVEGGGRRLSARNRSRASSEEDEAV
jgi:hypothetical protein